ncbi:helix-turn-helix transcriptional regulator [Serinicoccus sediminis]|uniref:helix-turn-helix transcriptional regulator n=1 Tax=Serinicoccus sediminis TaxID=2306021 RepID=UPI001EDFB98A|nr:response regulator transcription factor [Serinicoccus sediminis]
MGQDMITLRIEASDALTEIGAREVLGQVPDLQVLTGPQNGIPTDVVVVIVDTVDEGALERIRRAHAVDRRPVVLIAGALDPDTVLGAVEAGARTILRRQDACADTVADVVRSAMRGEGTVPCDVLGRLLDQVGHLQAQVLEPMGLRFNGLSRRETEVLRLVAEGLETAEIARRLNYSPRTIKGVLHDVSVRLNLRNRAHAVAYAMREGLI